MHFPVHLLIPLASSFGYVAAVLLLKRASAWGVGLWRTTFVSNLAMGVCFAPLWWLGGPGQDAAQLWQPALAGALFIVGQVATFVAIEGDVSVATPVLGLKILFVALFSTVLLADAVPLRWWFAAAFSSAAIVLLNRGTAGGAHRRIGRTVLAATGAAAAFALTDVLVQKWAPDWGAGRFVPFMFWAVAAFSFAMIPFFRAPLRAVPAAAWRWLGPGAIVLAFQAAGMAVTLAVFGEATAVNIVYSSRGLWSVVAVWLIGHWFHNEEQHLGAGVLRGRLSGAVLMLAAVLLVML